MGQKTCFILTAIQKWHYDKNFLDVMLYWLPFLYENQKPGLQRRTYNGIEWGQSVKGKKKKKKNGFNIATIIM